MTMQDLFNKIESTTDLDILNAARNRIAHGKSENSLVAWTMSDAWLDFQHDYPHRGNWNGASVMNSCSGEFEAK